MKSKQHVQHWHSVCLVEGSFNNIYIIIYMAIVYYYVYIYGNRTRQAGTQHPGRADRIKQPKNWKKAASAVWKFLQSCICASPLLSSSAKLSRRNTTDRDT